MDTVLDRLYRLAEPQAGYFTTSQARKIGVSRQELYYFGGAMPTTIHVTVPRAFGGHRKGVTVHRAELDTDERTSRDGVPVAAPLRTIADIAAGDPSDAGVALSEALERGIIRAAQVDRAAARYPEAEPVFAGAR